MASYSAPPPAAPEPVPGTYGFNASEAISYSWRKFGENSGQMLLATFLLFLVVIPGNYAGRALTDTDLDFSLGGAFSTIITGVLALMIGAVIARGALDITEGYPFDLVLALKMLNLVNVVAMALLVSVLTLFGFALLILPGIVILVLMLLPMYAVVDDDSTNAFEAIRHGFALISDNPGDATLLVLLSIAVAVLGVVALCIGALIAVPFLSIVWAYSYKVFSRKLVAP